MEITQSYAAPSTARPRGDGLGFSLSTEAARPGVHLEALVKKSRSYGRVMLALHRVVSGDARFKEADHSGYQAWVRGQYLLELAEEQKQLQRQLPALQSELEEVKAQLEPLDARAQELYGELQKLGHAGSKSFYDAQRKFWDYLYKADKALWWVLDPVVSVHPDATLFEVFSLDESSYGCVRVPTANLDVVGDVAYGTTNVDYSQALANEMARVRDYRGAWLSVGQEGISVQTTAGARVEKKIDLPPSWVRGFLQVQSASALATTELSLSGTVVAEILRLLNARREDKGPRSLKFDLVPGELPTVEIEPWGERVRETQFKYAGARAQTVRIWGRRRFVGFERNVAARAPGRSALAGRWFAFVLGDGIGRPPVRAGFIGLDDQRLERRRAFRCARRQQPRRARTVAKRGARIGKSADFDAGSIRRIDRRRPRAGDERLCRSCAARAARCGIR